MRKNIWLLILLFALAGLSLYLNSVTSTLIIVGIQIALIVLFRLKKRPSNRLPGYEMKRSTGDGTTVTNDELKYLEAMQCPDCDDHAYLWEGPGGGMCTNYLCPCCGSKYNVGAGMAMTGRHTAATAYWAQRINDGSRTPGFNEPDLTLRIKQAYLESKQSSIAN